MEEWKEVEKGLIPIADYTVDCQLNESKELIIWFSGKKKFKFYIQDVLGFRIIDESSELRDTYEELGLAEARPSIYKNFVYEVSNAEFGDIVAKLYDNTVQLHHYKLLSLNYVIDIVSADCIQIEEISAEIS